MGPLDRLRDAPHQPAGEPLPLYQEGDYSDESRYHLYAAALWLVAGIIDMVNQEWVGMWLCAIFMADELRKWWKNGGGDNFKKRLKKFKEKFVGQRRTAPQTA